MYSSLMGRAAGWIAVLFMLCGLSSAYAGADSASREAEIRSAFQEANAAKKQGPADIPLLDQATLKLPEHFLFVPRPAADKVLSALGNPVGDTLLGLIYGTGENDDWMAVVRFEKSGYIKDDDAKHWDVDELFDNLRQGTAEANKERASRGIPELELTGWVERPAYQAGPHHLVWSMGVKSKGDNDARANQSVNYNTYVLGRDGYLSVNFVTGAQDIAAQKPIAGTLLSSVSFLPGKTYADFNSSTDKMAEYGLAALVGGVAAKKLGLLAVIAAFAAKSFKLIAIAAVGVLAAIRKFFGAKKDEA
ncbi:MAG TPA: DUF2167 domain-containing protein [Rhodocyclaceae bacterium]|nr:DUF2167 domain-containing protein [Rhodocyclaceae bacterium]